LLHFTPNRYKSFKEAMLLSSKGNSLAGATAKQIALNKTSLLVMQLKKCPCFDIFERIFGQTPGVKPVHPKEGGGMAVSEADDDAADDAPPPPEELATAPPPADLATAPPRTSCAPPPAVRVPTTQALVAAPAPAAPGKGPAQFHLTPSKKAPKLDLGEAYLKAQESKIAAATVASQSKARCDLVIALTLQGKTSTEIAEFLLLCGL
jgi:hypothetical protein